MSSKMVRQKGYGIAKPAKQFRQVSSYKIGSVVGAYGIRKSDVHGIPSLQCVGPLPPSHLGNRSGDQHGGKVQVTTMLCTRICASNVHHYCTSALHNLADKICARQLPPRLSKTSPLASQLHQLATKWQFKRTRHGVA